MSPLVEPVVYRLNGNYFVFSPISSLMTLPSLKPIGVFDSGLGGLTVLHSINERLPGLSTIYLGDNANAPYGVKSFEEIFQYTLAGVRFLFSQGCPLVILACNSASAQALRKIQQEVLPKEFPDRRVIGVIRPTVEYLVEATDVKKIGVFATPATVSSQTYVEEFKNILAESLREIELFQVACPGLVDIVEAGLSDSPEADELVQKYCQNFSGDLALLGCTHYPFLETWFKKNLPVSTRVVLQGPVVAEKFEDYLVRHPEIDNFLKKSGERIYFTTGDLEAVSASTSRFYKGKINWLKASLSS
ncbi:MAG: Glutamate racemase [Candidatus Uhrbacteria bacterium GW2011_GWF2_44_350]|uniref:Glutamate racemase n=1 Tax=Candidatus Uhrbacteria bacterium GW2011_GWF2_44_350 TaxID=1619000 RepID=A0A0G1MCA6_9BACT|nr:MAG: Glutamate racemase [Candidatus Uhrbacteria bacterium GW2011_GWF2_44_350]